MIIFIWLIILTGNVSVINKLILYSESGNVIKIIFLPAVMSDILHYCIPVGL
jgi:hypothetical protein